MKVGDKIRHKRFNGTATIFRSIVQTDLDRLTNKTTVRTKYMAQLDTSPCSIFEFHGYDIGKTVFECKDDGQTTLFDSIDI